MSSTHNRIRAVAILALLGTPGYVLCYFWHVCMDGHMQHGPYPVYQWINDILWIACFASVLVFSIKMNAKGKGIFLVCSGLLILIRVTVGEMVVEIFLLVIMVAYAGAFLIQPGKYEVLQESNARRS
jgi:hypothetical protein